MKRLTLRVLSAEQLRDAQREAATMAASFGEDCALCACVIARAARVGGRRRFADGQAVLKALSAEAVLSLAEQYLARCRDGAELDAELARLAAAPAERLRWKILRTFHVLPNDPLARQLTPEMLRYCVANLLLDAGCAPEDAGRAAANETVEAVNTHFDEALFARRKEGVC